MIYFIYGHMKYRSRTDIANQILEAANGGTTKTKIMYNAYLSYAQLKEYLSMLIASGLIEHIPAENQFRTTEKGMMYLKTYDQMAKVTGSMIEVKA
jgi:predicted transcriptional regulator